MLPTLCQEGLWQGLVCLLGKERLLHFCSVLSLGWQLAVLRSDGARHMWYAIPKVKALRRVRASRGSSDCKMRSVGKSELFWDRV